MEDQRKPRGWPEFDRLARRLAAIPKKAMEKQIAKGRRRKKRAK